MGRRGVAAEPGVHRLTPKGLRGQGGMSSTAPISRDVMHRTTQLSQAPRGLEAVATYGHL